MRLLALRDNGNRLAGVCAWRQATLLRQYQRILRGWLKPSGQSDYLISYWSMVRWFFDCDTVHFFPLVPLLGFLMTALNPEVCVRLVGQAQRSEAKSHRLGSLSFSKIAAARRNLGLEESQMFVG